jgi:Tfp pilus assembly protein PilV
MNRAKIFFRSGQSLVEVTIATAALAFGLVSVISGMLLAVRNSSVSSTQAIATQKAQETIETFRRFQRTLGWETFYSIISADGSSITYCLNTLPIDSTTFQNMSVGACSFSSTNTNLVREATVVVTSSTEISVTATVKWRDGTTVRNATAKNIFRQY